MDGGAPFEHGFWCAFGEERADAVAPNEDGHHLAVTRELKGHESGQGAFVKLVGGVGAGGGVEGRGL